MSLLAVIKQSAITRDERRTAIARGGSDDAIGGIARRLAR
jgi:hypothetical protein